MVVFGRLGVCITLAEQPIPGTTRQHSPVIAPGCADWQHSPCASAISPVHCQATTDAAESPLMSLSTLFI